RRLLPALLVMLVAVGVAARWRIIPAARGDLRDAGLATLGYVANWNALRGGGYWEQTLTPSWLEHTWSLAIEEQFYLVWPLIAVAVLVVRRRGTRDPAPIRSRERRIRLLGTAALAGALLSAGGMIVASLAGASVERLYLGTDTRIAAILLGAAAACFQRATGSVVPVRGTARTVLAGGAVAALALLAGAWALLDGTASLLYRGGLLACGLAAVVVIVDISTPGPSLVARLLALRPLRALGTISYGLYLYHWPIFRLLGEADLDLGRWGLTAARIGLSLAVAVASHDLVEQPILRRRWRWPAVRLAPVGIAAAVLALLFGSIGAVDVSMDEQDATRPDLGARSAAERVVVTTPASGEAAAPGVGVQELIDPVVLVVGDSVAFSLAENGLVHQEKVLGLTTVDGAVIGCSLMLEPGSEPAPGMAPATDCSEDWSALVAEYQPDVVMALFGAPVGMRPTRVDGQEAWPCTARYDDRWRQRLDAAVEVLSSTGATVNLVTGPATNLPVEHMDDVEARQRCANDVVEEVAEDSPVAQATDLAEWVCPDDDCKMSIDGVRLREDGLHFEHGGALIASRWLAPHLRQVEVDPAASSSAVIDAG
ncbi:MAG TPA: acyltransferase family protein, partial [Iamia sp.]|nr:acyltransferase family protein [Iamia sp.]